MKTVKSMAELKQMALARGASVSVGTSRYNTDGEKVEKQPAVTKKEPEPQPMAAPAPAPAPTVNVDMAPVAASQERVAQMLSQALASIPQPSAPVREWLFTVERDENGLLTSIRATAQI
jgi:hypothetical protein